MSLEEFPLDFNFFGDFLDEIEEENTKIPDRQATKDEIQSLLKLIGGFEKWELLNEDCRREVVKYLDYKSRCQLGLCSKSNYATVEATPFYVYKVEMVDNEPRHYSFSDEAFDNVLVRIQFHPDFNSGKRFELIFSQNEEDTLIQWRHHAPRTRPANRKVVWKSKNYYQEAVKFAEKFMRKSNFELEAIKVEMSNYPFDASIIRMLPKCKNVRIGADDVETFNWWLERLPEQLDNLQLLTNSADRETFTLPTEFLNRPKITETPQFYFWCPAAFTDDQLLNLKSREISFDSVSITDEGINQYLKKWVNGRGVAGFKRALLWGEQDRNHDTLINGLDAREWDEDFEREALGFCFDFERCCGRGSCYQIKSAIDPYESLTLSIGYNHVSIYATGKRTTCGGRTFTYYRIP